MKHDKTIYAGERDHDGAHVTVNNRPLPLKPSLHVYNHSPTGFEWGYGGSGPAQLALAILLDFTGDEDLAATLYHTFKWEKVAHFNRDTFAIDGVNIRRWLEKQQRADACCDEAEVNRRRRTLTRGATESSGEPNRGGGSPARRKPSRKRRTA